MGSNSDAKDAVGTSVIQKVNKIRLNSCLTFPAGFTYSRGKIPRNN